MKAMPPVARLNTPIFLPLKSRGSRIGLSWGTANAQSRMPLFITTRTGMSLTTLAWTTTDEFICANSTFPATICCRHCSEAPTGNTSTSYPASRHQPSATGSVSQG